MFTSICFSSNPFTFLSFLVQFFCPGAWRWFSRAPRNPAPTHLDCQSLFSLLEPPELFSSKAALTPGSASQASSSLMVGKLSATLVSSLFPPQSRLRTRALHEPRCWQELRCLTTRPSSPASSSAPPRWSWGSATRSPPPTRGLVSKREVY